MWLRCGLWDLPCSVHTLGCGVWDLVDQGLRAPCAGPAVLASGPPGKSSSPVSLGGAPTPSQACCASHRPWRYLLFSATLDFAHVSP